MFAKNKKKLKKTSGSKQKKSHFMILNAYFGLTDTSSSWISPRGRVWWLPRAAFEPASLMTPFSCPDENDRNEVFQTPKSKKKTCILPICFHLFLSGYPRVSPGFLQDPFDQLAHGHLLLNGPWTKEHLFRLLDFHQHRLGTLTDQAVAVQRPESFWPFFGRGAEWPNLWVKKKCGIK